MVAATTRAAGEHSAGLIDGTGRWENEGGFARERVARRCPGRRSTSPESQGPRQWRGREAKGCVGEAQWQHNEPPASGSRRLRPRSCGGAPRGSPFANSSIRWSPAGIAPPGVHRPRTTRKRGSPRRAHAGVLRSSQRHGAGSTTTFCSFGDGEVVDHFAQQIRVRDRSRDVDRRIEIDKSGPMTEPQLLARIRAFAGSSARRTFPT